MQNNPHYGIMQNKTQANLIYNLMSNKMLELQHD